MVVDDRNVSDIPSVERTVSSEFVGDVDGDDVGDAANNTVVVAVRTAAVLHTRGEYVPFVAVQSG